jgi:spermidine synthase
MVRAFLAAVLGLSLVTGAVPAAKADTFIHTEKSLYHNIYVSEDEGTRCIRFNSNSSTVLSCFTLKNPENILFDCNRMILGTLYLRPNPRKILMIGLGGGTLTTAFSAVVPGAEIDVVELDPAMVRVAKEYFGFKPTPKIRMIVEDGRVYVKRAIAKGEKYDLIILDAFGERYIPPHMMTHEFLNEVKQVLANDGVVAANTHRAETRYDSESATYHMVFGNFFNLNKPWKKTRVIIAKPSGLPSQDFLARNARYLDHKLRRLGVDPGWLLPLFSTEQDWDDQARIITDWYTPF